MVDCTDRRSAGHGSVADETLEEFLRSQEARLKTIFVRTVGGPILYISNVTLIIRQ